jgi:hypothetical protein
MGTYKPEDFVDAKERTLMEQMTRDIMSEIQQREQKNAAA